MRTCQGCGGVLGRDCFNEDECVWITQDMQRRQQEEYAMDCRALERERSALAERCERLEALVQAIVSGRGHCFIPTDDLSRPTFNWDERAADALSGSSGGKDG